MIHPSGVHRPENVKLEIEEIARRIYVVRNAYTGDYEYFPGQVLIKDVGNPEDEVTAEMKEANNSTD